MPVDADGARTYNRRLAIARMTPGFSYERSRLVCDGVSLAAVADDVGTPAYVYSASVICSRYREFDGAFGSYPHTVHYALKANSTLAIVRLLRSLGAGVDANSGGEIEVALRAGFEPGAIMFTGVGKSLSELDRAVALGLRAINAESPGEIDRIAALARDRRTRAEIALRVNPEIDARSHPHISTALRESKFGIPIQEALGVCRDVARRPELRLVGLHVHIGSQIVALEPLVEATAALVSLASVLAAEGIAIDHLDVGGGLGIAYDESYVPTPADYAAALLPVVRGSGLEIVLEPGRTIVGPAGVLMASVVDTKRRADGRALVVLDAGMTELLRPALYGARHRIVPVHRSSAIPVVCDVVGPLCESSDVFATGCELAPPAVGDRVAILDAGAYGAVMASNYNRRPLPPEVMIEAGEWRLIRRRQSVDDLLALEG